jgi:hypothetical protein
VVEGVRALIETFGGDENLAALEGSSSRLQDSLRKIQENPQPYATYIVIAFAAVTIRWAAHEFGRTDWKSSTSSQGPLASTKAGPGAVRRTSTVMMV